MSGAATRGAAGGRQALPLQRPGATRHQGEAVNVEVRALGLVRAAADDVHEVGIDEGLVLVAGAGAVSLGC